MRQQIRIYTINRGALQTFAEEWRQHLKPLRESLGFMVPAAWTVVETNQFIWLMQLDNDSDWEQLDQAYFDSDARKAMQPNPARHIARMEHYFIEPAD